MKSADFATMRRAMVDSQLRTSGVTEPWVVAAMGAAPREDFVPEALRTTAYMDRSIVLADGRTLNPPVVTALMLQAAEVTASDTVLLIGARNGYAASLLAGRAAKLTAIESLADLETDGFSLIFIDGAIEELPDSLVAVVKEGGRIVTGMTERGVTSLALGIKRGGQTALRRFADSEIAPLAGFARKPEFVF